MRLLINKAWYNGPIKTFQKNNGPGNFFLNKHNRIVECGDQLNDSYFL